MSAELAARRTAAAAVLGDFRAAEAAFGRGQRDQPVYAAWALRLAAELASLLQRLEAEDPAGEPVCACGHLARVHNVVTSGGTRGHCCECDRGVCKRYEAAQPALAAQLAEIRLVLDAFDWETDDRQYALEQIAEIVNGGAA